jgi:hypothetical protein
LDQHIHNTNSLLQRASNLADRLFSNNIIRIATAKCFSISQTDALLKAAAVSFAEWLTGVRLQAAGRLWIGLQQLLGYC